MPELRHIGEQWFGSAQLIDTVVRGPKQFFTQYIGICASDPQLPKLPPGVVQAIDDMPEKI